MINSVAVDITPRASPRTKEVLIKYKETRSRLFQQAGIAPSSTFVTTHDSIGRIHYLELGDGPPLVIIHGGLSHSSEWINILEPLARHFHLYVVDRPGHGLSDSIDYRGIDFRSSAVAFIRSFMDTIGLEKALLMGNSMGGYFSLCFALAHPERVEKLLLIGAPAGLNRWIPPMLRVLGISGLNRLLMKTVAKPSVASQKSIHRQLLVADVSKLSDDYFKHNYYGHLLPGARVAMSTLLESVLTVRGWRKELYLAHELDQLPMPVHFVWGDRDAFESPTTGIQKASIISNHTFEVVSNAGHCPWLDQPETCVSLLLNALSK